MIRASGERIALLHQGAGSTIDHFLRGPLEALGARIVEVDSARAPDAMSLQDLEGCRLVVVVRYLPRPWLAPVQRLRRGGAEVAFLMDDDLLDPAALGELPRLYRRRLWQRITRLHRRLPGLVDRLWVTSSTLEEKYTHVELFGDHAINRHFRALPRVRILHPMRWPNFLAETGSGRIDILLTPLLASPFNAGRAPVKVIDAARSGAAGLYSDRAPYRGFVRDGIDGLLLDDQHASWLAGIERLIADPEERRRLAAGGRQRALELVRGPGS